MNRGDHRGEITGGVHLLRGLPPSIGLPDGRYFTGLCPVFWLLVRNKNDSNTGQCMCQYINILYHQYWHCQCPVFLREPPTDPTTLSWCHTNNCSERAREQLRGS